MPTPAAKHDAGKDPWHLLPWDAARAVVKVLAFGASKYGERNWEQGLKYSRLFAAAQRHLLAWFEDGEDTDEESSLPALAHAACCVLMLLAFQLRGRKDLDDRPLGEGLGQSDPAPASQCSTCQHWNAVVGCRQGHGYVMHGRQCSDWEAKS